MQGSQSMPSGKKYSTQPGLFFHSSLLSSAAWKSKAEVLAGLASGEACSWLAGGHVLAVSSGHLSSALGRALLPSSPHKVTNPWDWAPPMVSFNLTPPPNRPSLPIQPTLGLGLQHAGQGT